MKINIKKNLGQQRREAIKNFSPESSNKSFGSDNRETLLSSNKEVLSNSRSRMIKKDQKNNDKESNLVKKIINWIVKFSIYATVFFLPLFFLPVTTSVLEMNKQFLLVILVGIGFLAWVGKMAWENKIKFKKTFILVPAITFLGILALSGIFSVYRENSIWGLAGEEGKSFITVVFLVAMFVLVLNNIKNKKEAYKVLFTLLISGFFVCLYGTLQIWGKFIIPGAVFENTFFNSVGSVYVFEAYIAALFILCVGLFLENINKIAKILIIILSFFFFFTLLVINLSIIWWALLFALALILGASTVKNGATSSQARVLPMIFLVLALMALLIGKPIVGKKQMPVEVYLNYKTSAKLTLSSWKENALLGKGSGNYSMVYKLNRPDNLGQFWSVNFNNGSNFFFTLASTTGILGTLAFLFLVGTGVYYLFKGMSLAVFNKDGKNNFIVVALGAVWLFLTILVFTYFTSITTWMLWWLSLALFLSFLSFDDNKSKESQEFVAASENPRSSFTLTFSFVLIIIGLIVAIYMQSQKYMASIYFYQALKANNQAEELEKIAGNIQKAINANPENDNYYRNMAVALFALANQRVAEKGQDLSAEDSNYVSAMITESLKAADSAVQVSNEDSQNYVALAQIYEGVIATMEKADEKAIENYQKALKYDPNNPSLYTSMANINLTLAEIEITKAQQQQQQQQGQGGTGESEIPKEAKEYLAKAKENVEKALEIKSNYTTANLLLPTIYERQGDLAKAIELEKENKEIYSGDPAIDFRLGLLYYKDKNWDEAVKSFSNALALNKDYANSRYFLALTYNEQGEENKALEQLEEIYKNNEDNENLAKMIDNLKNNKELFDGLEGNQQENTPIEEEAVQPSENDENNIDPGVENQEIPEEAVPTPEEIEGSDEEDVDGNDNNEEDEDKDEDKD